MDTSRTHLIAQLCRAVLVGWLIVPAVSCTPAPTPPISAVSPAPQTAGKFRWQPRDVVPTGYLDGTWATGELSAATLRTSLVESGLGRCASRAAGELGEHQLILRASGSRWTLFATDAGESEVLTRGSYSANRRGPTLVRLSLSSAGRTELSGNGVLMLGGSNYNNVTIRMRSLDPEPSCITAAEAIAWFMMRFAKTSVR